MVLNDAKRIALLQLTNCVSSCNVETIKQLSDGKLFCDIIENVFPETLFELLSRERQNFMNCEEQSKDERFCSNVDFLSENHETICADTGSENAVKEDSGPVQKYDIELIKSAVSDTECAIQPTKSAGDSFTEQANPGGEHGETVTMSTKSVVCDSEFVFKPVESAESKYESLKEPAKSSGGDTELVLKSIKFADSDDVSEKYRLIQHFIDVRYNLKSETVITFSECWNANELELAKVSIFILSEVVRHYVHVNNPIIQTLSHLDIKVQQDLEHCFNFFINERSKITREEVKKILSSHAPYKISSSPNRSYFATPRRSCSSKYRRPDSPSTSPLQESVYSDSPLKTYFDSPIFTKADIVFKEKEIFKIRQILYEEETKSYGLQQKVKDLEMKLIDKDKEINSFKVKYRLLQENEKSEDCENCKKQEKIIEENKRRIKELEVDIKENNEETCKKFEDIFLEYQVDVADCFSQFKYNLREAENEIRAVSEELEETKKKKDMNEETIKKLSAELDEKTKELDVYKEKLSDADARIKEEPESPVFGECIGRYFKEENEKFQIDITPIKLEVVPVERSLKHVMVQFPEQKTDTEYQVESDVLMPELPVSNDVPDSENFQNFTKSSESVCKEWSGVCDVSNKPDTTAKQFAGSPGKEVPFADNSYPPVTNDGFGSLWHQYNNSFSESENVDGVSCADNGLPKALNILQKTESELNQMTKHLSAVSKASPGPNGSNGLVGSPILKEFMEELKKSVRKSVLCLSQTGESQMRFQNNNSISKNIMIDETGGNSDSAVFSKCFECLKVGSDLPNSIATINQDNAALLEKTQEIDSLKEKYKVVLKSRNLKEKELENYKKKNSFLRSEYRESVRSCKEIELKCQKLEMELKDARKKENDFKRDSKREKNILKMQIREMGEKWQKLQSCVLSCQIKVKNINEENKKLQDEISSHKIQNEELSLHIKYLEKQIEDSNSNVHLKALSSNTNTTLENDVLPSIKGIKDEYTLLENTNDGFLKPESPSPSLNEVTSLDTGNESVSTGALSSKSLHSGFHYFTDDEEGFLNYSSIADIHKDFENADVQNSIRLQELRRRNTLYPFHLQSCYPAEGVSMTPTDKNLSKDVKSKKSKVIKSGYQLENNVHNGKKRKVSEVETQNQSNQSLATPTVKTKRKFLETPSSLKKWCLYRRNQRPGSIKPKP